MKIWLLKISHRHGEDISLHATRAALDTELYDYVSEEWDEGLSVQYGELETLPAHEAIEAYFHAWGHSLQAEFYEAHEFDFAAHNPLLQPLEYLANVAAYFTDCTDSGAGFSNRDWAELAKAEGKVRKAIAEHGPQPAPLNEAEEDRITWEQPLAPA